MTEWHMKAGTKASGGRSTTPRRCGKKLAWKGGNFSATTIGKPKVDVKRVRGGKVVPKLKRALYANISEKGGNKLGKYEIANVELNDADRQYARRNIITKGAKIIVRDGTSEKWALVTSKPGSSGVVNAVFIGAELTEKAKKRAVKAEKAKDAKAKKEAQAKKSKEKAAEKANAKKPKAEKEGQEKKKD